MHTPLNVPAGRREWHGRSSRLLWSAQRGSGVNLPLYVSVMRAGHLFSSSWDISLWTYTVTSLWDSSFLNYSCNTHINTIWWDIDKMSRLACSKNFMQKYMLIERRIRAKGVEEKISWLFLTNVTQETLNYGPVINITCKLLQKIFWKKHRKLYPRQKRWMGEQRVFRLPEDI